MKVLTFDLNDAKTAKLIVTVSNVPPILQTTPALIHVPGGGFMFCSEADGTAIASRCMGKGFGNLYIFVSCSQRLPFPQVVIDLIKGIKILRDHAERMGN